MENSFLNTILTKDKELLIYLNNLGNEQWDSLWFFITNQLNWIPLYIIILFFIYKKLGVKRTIFVFLFIALLIAFSDQITNLVKNHIGRLRPCNTPELTSFLREFTYKPRGLSFWSGHAATSTTFTVFVILLLRKTYKYIYFLLLFPLVFGFSRIYLGVHYPIDVASGYVAGAIMGSLLFMLFKFLFEKVFKEKLI
ncbi:phosphatase PAP2 family protein [Tenacibaculum sp. IB213877]|uniref:phosphatase PAP2 family protein n=1 Tax=Tenacibaculum sp. IB213877 TaxID=3097351 RepID=UPI002A5ABA35|nr:phosphatase PAP2 family protein [Tenacibaculum sp. IB213877]MDY0779853.1 phosphatase PAP2 family protein [Tenacibaculum sp. IB213877]